MLPTKSFPYSSFLIRSLSSKYFWTFQHAKFPHATTNRCSSSKNQFHVSCTMKAYCGCFKAWRNLFLVYCWSPPNVNSASMQNTCKYLFLLIFRCFVNVDSTSPQISWKVAHFTHGRLLDAALSYSILSIPLRQNGVKNNFDGSWMIDNSRLKCTVSIQRFK